MYIYVSKVTIIGSDNGLMPGRCQAIIWTNAGTLLIGPLGANFKEISIKIYIFSFKKINLKMLSGKCWPFCPSLNVSTQGGLETFTKWLLLFCRMHFSNAYYWKKMLILFIQISLNFICTGAINKKSALVRNAFRINADLLSIAPIQIKFSEMTFVKKMPQRISIPQAARTRWLPFCRFFGCWFYDYGPFNTLISYDGH